MPSSDRNIEKGPIKESGIEIIYFSNKLVNRRKEPVIRKENYQKINRDLLWNPSLISMSNTG